MVQPENLRTIFMGTPEFALQTLEGLLVLRGEPGWCLYSARPSQGAR